MNRMVEVHLVMRYVDKVGGIDEPVCAYSNIATADLHAGMLDVATQKYHYVTTVHFNPEVDTQLPNEEFYNG